MKTTIFSLTVILAFLINFDSIAQKANGFDANSKAKSIIHPLKVGVEINQQQAIAVDDVTDLRIYSITSCACDIPVPRIAKYISPLGYSQKLASDQLTSVAVNNTQVQSRK